MSLEGFLHAVVGLLDRCGVPYVLTGSLASAYYAVPRATQDLDVVIAADEGGVERMVQALLERNWYVDPEAAQRAQRARGQFNAIDPGAGWKVDFIVRKDRAFSQVEFQRRQRVTVLDVEVSIASLEDVLIAKLEWGRLGDSEIQRQDVVQLLERTWERLDHPYIENWIDQLDLRAEWARALARASRIDERS